jgi:hypothetical protein
MVNQAQTTPQDGVFDLAKASPLLTTADLHNPNILPYLSKWANAMPVLWVDNSGTESGGFNSTALAYFQAFNIAHKNSLSS